MSPPPWSNTGAVRGSSTLLGVLGGSAVDRHRWTQSREPDLAGFRGPQCRDGGLQNPFSMTGGTPRVIWSGSVAATRRPVTPGRVRSPEVKFGIEESKYESQSPLTTEYSVSSVLRVYTQVKPVVTNLCMCVCGATNFNTSKCDFRYNGWRQPLSLRDRYDPGRRVNRRFRFRFTGGTGDHLPLETSRGHGWWGIVERDE